MSTLIYVITHIITPISILIIIGFIFQRSFKTDTRTLSRLLIYILTPAVIFIKIYQTDVTFGFFAIVAGYILMIELCMLLIAEIISRLMKYPRSMKKAFSNSLLFFNSGNYGLPMADLIFKSNPIAVTCQLFIMIVQNITANTFGVFQASSGNSSTKNALKNIFMIPTLYVLFVVIFLKTFGIEVPQPLYVPIKYLSDGFIGFALITLGIQLAEIKTRIRIKDILLASSIRLFLSPCIGLLLVLLFGLKGIMAQALIIGASTPSAVNTVIIAREYKNEPDYAAQVVLATTLFSSVSISIVIYFVMKFF